MQATTSSSSSGNNNSAMEDPFNMPVSRRDLLRLRTIVQAEHLAPDTWRRLRDVMLSAQAGKDSNSKAAVVVLKDSRSESDSTSTDSASEEILETLRLWRESDHDSATLANFLTFLEHDNDLKPLAQKISTEFRQSVPETQKSTKVEPQRRPKPEPDQKPEPTPSKPEKVSRFSWRKPGASRPNPQDDFKYEITHAVPAIMKSAQNLSQVLALLLSEDVLQANELELIQSKQSEADKWATLAYLFVRKGASTWGMFKEALADYGNAPLVNSFQKH